MPAPRGMPFCLTKRYGGLAFWRFRDSMQIADERPRPGSRIVGHRKEDASMAQNRAARIAELNDQFRKNPFDGHGQIMMTRAAHALGHLLVELRALR